MYLHRIWDKVYLVISEMESVLEKLDANSPEQSLTALKKFNTEVSLTME